MEFLTSTAGSLIIFVIGLAIFIALCFTKVPRIYAVLLAVLVFAFGINAEWTTSLFTTFLGGTVTVIQSYLFTTLSGAAFSCIIRARTLLNTMVHPRHPPAQVTVRKSVRGALLYTHRPSGDKASSTSSALEKYSTAFSRAASISSRVSSAHDNFRHPEIILVRKRVPVVTQSAPHKIKEALCRAQIFARIPPKEPSRFIVVEDVFRAVR